MGAPADHATACAGVEAGRAVGQGARPLEVEAVHAWLGEPPVLAPMADLGDARPQGGLGPGVARCRVEEGLGVSFGDELALAGPLDEQRRALWVKSIEQAPERDASYTVPASGEAFSDADHAALAEYHAANSPELQKLRGEIEALKKQLAAIQPVTTPVMRELPPDKRRRTHIQVRGNFLDLGAEVEPGVPTAFHSLEGAQPDRCTEAELRSALAA